jgi:hypothetical protein
MLLQSIENYGCHCGKALDAEVEVSRVKGMEPEPSAFNTHTFVWPLAFEALLPSTARAEQDATFVPSCDQVMGRTKPVIAAVSWDNG